MLPDHRSPAENSSFHWEDVVIGVKSQSGSVLLSREEILTFARTWDPHPVHLADTSAQALGYEQITAPGTQLLALRQKLMHDLPLSDGVLVSLGYEKVRFHGGLCPGQHCHVAIEWLDKRLSRSRPGQGIATMTARLYSGDRLLMSLQETVLMRCRNTQTVRVSE